MKIYLEKWFHLPSRQSKKCRIRVVDLLLLRLRTSQIPKFWANHWELHQNSQNKKNKKIKKTEWERPLKNERSITNGFFSRVLREQTNFIEERAAIKTGLSHIFPFKSVKHSVFKPINNSKWETTTSEGQSENIKEKNFQVDSTCCL